MEKKSPRRANRKPPLLGTEEIFEDPPLDYPEPSPGQKYFPALAYTGIILAILLGAVIIAISIIISSGRAPSFLGNFNAAGVNSNLNSGAKSLPAIMDIPLSPDYPMLGSKDAPVTLVEFADFQCPYCKKFQDQTFAHINRKYIDTGIAKFYFLHFPFLGPESQAAAVAAECARQQDKFWQYHDSLYAAQGLENSNAFSDAVLKKLAKQLGLNAAKFAACQTDQKTAAAIDAQFQAGKDAGVEATPTVFINGQKNEGDNPFAGYQAEIEQARKGQ